MLFIEDESELEQMKEEVRYNKNLKLVLSQTLQLFKRQLMSINQLSVQLDSSIRANDIF